MQETKEDAFWEGHRADIRKVEKALADAGGVPEMVGAKPDGNVKRGGVAMLKTLIISRTGTSSASPNHHSHYLDYMLWSACT